MREGGERIVDVRDLEHDARVGAVGRDELEHELAEIVKLRAARGDVEKPRLGARGGFEDRRLDP